MHISMQKFPKNYFRQVCAKIVIVVKNFEAYCLFVLFLITFDEVFSIIYFVNFFSINRICILTLLNQFT